MDIEHIFDCFCCQAPHQLKFGGDMIIGYGNHNNQDLSIILLHCIFKTPLTAYYLFDIKIRLLGTEKASYIHVEE